MEKNVILIYLAKNNNTNLVEKVLGDSHIDLNTTDHYGDTALIWAGKNNNFNMCRILIDAGADWNIFNKDGNSFLDYLGTHRQHIVEIYVNKYNDFLSKIQAKKYNL